MISFLNTTFNHKYITKAYISRNYDSKAHDESKDLETRGSP